MNFKKRVNGSWVDTPNYIHKTDTDTITTLPAVIYPTDTTATVGLKGNTIQDGTPSPDAPVEVVGCGLRTENLFDKNATIYNAYINENGYWALSLNSRSVKIPCHPNTTYTIKIHDSSYSSLFRLAESSDPSTIPYSETAGPLLSLIVRTTNITEYTFTTKSDSVVLVFQGISSPNENTWINTLMLNLGSEALPYEPYGYKIPISSADTTTPVYLGEVETTRKIKKLVLDGTENWTYRSGDPANVFFMYLPTAKTGEVAMSNAYPYYSGTDFVDMNDKEFSIIRSNLAIRNSDYQYESQFKAYLQQQYAAGTPVTVWYVLATEETAVVNEPLHKIGDYADEVANVSIPVTAGGDTLSVDTTVQPSEVTVNYKGWHTTNAKEWDGSQWS